MVHEIHHALRFRHAGPWCVGENLVLEGLALAAEEAIGCPPASFDPLPSAVADALLHRGQTDRDIAINPEASPEAFDWIWQRQSEAHVANMFYVGRAIVTGALEESELTAFDVVDRPYQWFFEAMRT